MKLLDIAKETQDLLNDGIMSVAVYKQGRSWKYAELYCCDFVEGEGFTWEFDEEAQRQEVLNIMKIDSNAVIINGYNSPIVQGSVQKIYEGLKYAYDSKHFLLSDEKENVLNGEIAPWKSSNLDIKSEPTEEDIKGMCNYANKCYGKRESEYRELYSMAIDEYDDTIELLKLYNDKFYDYVTELRTRGNTYETCIYNALYCIKSGRIPDEDRR